MWDNNDQLTSDRTFLVTAEGFRRRSAVDDYLMAVVSNWVRDKAVEISSVGSLLLFYDLSSTSPSLTFPYKLKYSHIAGSGDNKTFISLNNRTGGTRFHFISPIID